MPSPSKFNAYRARALLKRSKWTRAALAVELGLNPGTVGDYFAGKVDPQAGTVGRLALLLGVPVEKLYTKPA